MLQLLIEVATMKTAALLAAASILLASAAIVSTSASAQSAAPPVLTPAPPPPGIHDPGVKAVTPKAATAPVIVTKSTSGANLPSMQDPDTANDGKHMNLPDVSRHQEGENEIEEYRRSGMLYMVVVTPRNGIPQSYNVDPDGTRHMQTGEAPVHPAMYKVLEWGKSKPAEADSSGEP
jgi:hypothetical protein